MRRNSITIAVVIAVLTALWLASGALTGDDETAPPAALGGAVAEAPARAVRARRIHAVTLPQRVEVRGRTENKRTVDVRAETTGRVVARPVERGDRVERGDLLCRLALDDRQAKREQAAAAIEVARLEHAGAIRLANQGLQSETAIAQAKARLATAEAQRAAVTLDIDRTRIRAPFGGVVETTALEVGDYAQPGAPCARVVDLDPMLLVGRVAETAVRQITVGASARARLGTGEQVEGPVRFVATQADPDTRTYRVEVAIPNPDFSVPSGVTAQFEVVTGAAEAHKVSPALLALDDEGRIGVRTVDGGQRVVFNRVEIVADEADGVWVSGLPRVATLITVGHQFVVAGQAVEVTFEQVEPSDPPAAPLAATRAEAGAAAGAEPGVAAGT